MSISRESWVLLALCLSDLMSTISLVHAHSASEGNPFMAYFLSLGLSAFILAKLFFSIGPISVAEYARRNHPRSVQVILRTAIATYLVAYVGGITLLNSMASGSAATLLHHLR